MAGSNGFSVLLTVEADQDKEAIVDWYEDNLLGLGREWLAEYERTERIISVNPSLYAENLLFIRTAVLRKFPYTVYYRTDEAEQVVVILGILHQRQDRDEILRRINLIE